MSTALCFNELSGRAPAPDREAGAALAATLARVLAGAVRHRTEFRTNEEFWATELCRGYTMGEWARHPQTDRELRQILLARATSSRLLRPSDPVHNRADTVECRWNGTSALGLTAAHLLGGVAVSLDVLPWRAPWIEVDELALDLSAEVTTQPCVVANAGRPEGLRHHLEERAAQASPPPPSALWAARAQFFPRLRFCPQVESDLRGFVPGEPAWGSVVARLRALDDAAAAPFDPTQLTKCTPESGPTLATFHREHTFRTEEGAAVLFSWHLRFTPGCGRVFFAPRPADAWLVGTVSRNGLPTVKAPT